MNDFGSASGTGEIGVPPYFAMRLSFPERVTAHNVERLREVSCAPNALTPACHRVMNHECSVPCPLIGHVDW